MALQCHVHNAVDLSSNVLNETTAGNKIKSLLFTGDSKSICDCRRPFYSRQLTVVHVPRPTVDWQTKQFTTSRRLAHIWGHARNLFLRGENVQKFRASGWPRDTAPS